MSFWTGVVKGVESNRAERERKAEREDLEDARDAARRWQETMFEYTSRRDSLLDDKEADKTRVEQERYDTAQAIAEDERTYSRTTAAMQAAREEKWKNKNWTLTIDKWDQTKGNNKQAQANADRIFTQSIAVFDANNKQYTAQSLRADSAEARAVAQALYQKERDRVGDETAKANFDRRVAEWDTSVSQWNKQFGLSEEKFEESKKYSDRSWNLELEKWDATKDSVEQAQKNADRIYDQSLSVFLENSKRYTIESLRADRTEARVVADGIFAKERLVIGDETAEQARQDRLGQFDQQTEQWNKQFGLSKLASDRAGEEIELKRTEKLLALLPPGMVALMSGGTTRTPSDNKTMSVNAMTAGSAAFKAELANMGEDEQSSDFFEAALRSPGAQATIMSFMEAQAKKGNTVELKDMPKYFKYLGSAPGKGEKEVKEFMESMLSGDANVGDKDTFIKGLTAINNFWATEEMFVQTGAPASLTDQTQQYNTWKESVEMEAYRAVKGLPPEQQEAVRQALAMLKIPEDSQEGMDRLASMGYGRTLAMSGNYVDHPIISSYYQDTEAVDADAQAAIDAKVRASGDVTTFNTWEEVTAARNEGFSGNVSVDGVLKYAPPIAIEPIDADGVPTVKETKDALTPSSGEFLDTGEQKQPALPENTDIDAIFGDTLKSPIAVEENTSMFPDRPDQDLGFKNIEEGISGLMSAVKGFEVAPEGASKSAKLRETQAFDMVVQELEDMGIQWPTNREELGYFRDDLVSLVSEYSVELPNEIMVKLVEKAKESSAVGVIPEGDLARIKKANEENDKDTLSNLMNKYGVGPVTDAIGLGN